MGIQKSVITFSGKIGGLRGSSWKGKKVVAQQPSTYNDAKTPVQQANRRKFADVQLLGRQVLAAVKVGLKTQAIGKTEANVFTQLNMPAASDDGSVATIALDDVKVAKGNLAGVSNYNVAPGNNAGQLVLTWNNNSNGGSGLPTDMICTCDVCEYKQPDSASTFTMHNVNRAAGTVTITMPASHVGHEAHVYAFFRRAGTNEVSDSSVDKAQVPAA